MARAALHNLGCKVNAYETDAMQQMLEAAGFEIVPFSETADVYVINTCSVTNIADHKSRQMLHKARKQNPEAVVVACGCYVQTAKKQAESDDSIDIIIGNNRKNDLVRLIHLFLEQKQSGHTEKNVLVPEINQGTFPYEEQSIRRPSGHTRAFLKVQDGCNQFCSYCIIPYARGRIRSRDPEHVLEEVSRLASEGVQEIVLTGIHLSSYGKELGLGLLDLIRKVHEIEGICRIRLGSLEPGIITDEFVSELASFSKVCPHFHLSLQSGCDRVLKRMNRHYTADEYYEKVTILRRYYEHPAITTDIIVGFPGETEEDFAETCAFAEKVEFFETHIFKYSRRDGTPAARMPDQIPESVKTERSKKLQKIHERNSAKFRNWYAGKKAEVLFEEEHVRNGIPCFSGYTPEYVRVTMPSGQDLRNRIMEVEFSDCLY